MLGSHRASPPETPSAPETIAEASATSVLPFGPRCGRFKPGEAERLAAWEAEDQKRLTAWQERAKRTLDEEEVREPGRSPEPPKQGCTDSREDCLRRSKTHPKHHQL